VQFSRPADRADLVIDEDKAVFSMVKAR